MAETLTATSASPAKVHSRVRFWLGLLLLGCPLWAEVNRVEITQRIDVGSSGYEKIVGRLHFAVDPQHPRNRVIVDLAKAPLNAAKRVEFSADL